MRTLRLRDPVHSRNSRHSQSLSEAAPHGSRLYLGLQYAFGRSRQNCQGFFAHVDEEVGRAGRSRRQRIGKNPPQNIRSRAFYGNSACNRAGDQKRKHRRTVSDERAPENKIKSQVVYDHYEDTFRPHQARRSHRPRGKKLLRHRKRSQYFSLFRLDTENFRVVFKDPPDTKEPVRSENPVHSLSGS